MVQDCENSGLEREVKKKIPKSIGTIDLNPLLGKEVRAFMIYDFTVVLQTIVYGAYLFFIFDEQIIKIG